MHPPKLPRLPLQVQVLAGLQAEPSAWTFATPTAPRRLRGAACLTAVLAQGRALQAGAPLAAISWENFTPGAISKTFKSFKDKVYYGDVLPPVGSQTISYARFLHLLSTRMVRPPAARLCLIEGPCMRVGMCHASRLQARPQGHRHQHCGAARAQS